MLKQAIYIGLNYLTTTFRYRSTLIFALAMPLVFTIVLGSVMGGGASDAPASWTLVVSDTDGSALSRALVDRLSASGELALQDIDAITAEAALRDGDLAGVLTIPAGFGEALTNGERQSLTLRLGGIEARTDQAVEQAVRAATAELEGTVRSALIAAGAVSAATANQDTRVFNRALARAGELWAGTLPVSVVAAVEASAEGVAQNIGGFNQSSPGMLVTFGLVFMLNGATLLVIERQQGTLRRLLVLPLQKAAIMTGKLSGIWVAGITQGAILILAGALAFRVPWGRSPAALALMVVAFGLSISSLGIMIAGLARTYAQANALTNILMYSIAAFGGAWWPIEITPQWMQHAAMGVPTYWAMQGFQDIIVRGLGVRSVLPEAAALAAFGLAFLTIGVWRFRYE